MLPERAQASRATVRQPRPSMKSRASSVLRVLEELTIPESSRFARVACRWYVVPADGEIASIQDVVRCPHPVPSPCVRLERDSVLTVAMAATVTAVEHLHQHVVALGADPQPELLLMIREVVERHDRGLAPVVAHGEHLWDVGAKHREVAPTDFRTLLPRPDHALGPVQQRLRIAP